jgi:hypothetical protein
MKQAATGRLMGGIQLDREFEVKALFTAGITNTEAFATGTTQWSDYTGVSHPILDVAEAKYIVSKSGVEANMLALGPDVIKALTNHPDLIDRFKFTNPTGNLTLDQISAALQISAFAPVRWWSMPTTSRRLCGSRWPCWRTTRRFQARKTSAPRRLSSTPDLASTDTKSSTSPIPTLARSATWSRST